MGWCNTIFKTILLACVLHFVTSQPTLAQQSDWKKRWEATLAAARAEGEVIVATSPNQLRREFLQKRWQKDFPDIRLNLASVRGSSFLPKLATERKAGKYLWDVFQTGPSSGIRAAKNGYFDPLVPELILPEVADQAVWGGWQDAFFDEARTTLLGTVGDVVAPYYNAAKVSPDRVKTEGLRLLLDPEFKGKIVWYDPRRNGPGGLPLMLFKRQLGNDGLRKLVVDQDPIFVDSYHAVAEAMVRGKAVIAISGKPEADLKEFKEAGIKMDVRTFGASPKVAYRTTAGSTLAIFNKRPHPNAARVFANWYLTKAVSEDIAKATFFNSLRKDVPPVSPSSAAEAGATNYTYPQRTDKEYRALRNQVKEWRPQ